MKLFKYSEHQVYLKLGSETVSFEEKCGHNRLHQWPLKIILHHTKSF